MSTNYLDTSYTLTTTDNTGIFNYPSNTFIYPDNSFIFQPDLNIPWKFEIPTTFTPTEKSKLISKLYKFIEMLQLRDEDYTKWLDEEIGPMLDILLLGDQISTVEA